VGDNSEVSGFDVSGSGFLASRGGTRRVHFLNDPQIAWIFAEGSETTDDTD